MWRSSIDSLVMDFEITRNKQVFRVTVSTALCLSRRRAPTPCHLAATQAVRFPCGASRRVKSDACGPGQSYSENFEGACREMRSSHGSERVVIEWMRLWEDRNRNRNRGGRPGGSAQIAVAERWANASLAPFVKAAATAADALVAASKVRRRQACVGTYLGDT